MEYVKYDFGFMFAYSERPGTPASKKMEDDVPMEVKKGDRILFSKYAGSDIKIDDVEHVFMKEEDVLAILE